MTTLTEIHNATARRFGMEPDELRGDTRERRISWPRQLAMSLMRDAGYQWSRIGLWFSVDHSTVIHGCKAAQARVGSDPAWYGHRQAVIAYIGGIEIVERPAWKHDTQWIPPERMEEYRSWKAKLNLCPGEIKSLMLARVMPSSPPSAS